MSIICLPSAPAYVLVLLAVNLCGTALAEQVVSDGSDGPFHPTSSRTIVLNDEAPDGVFNFTTIHVPRNVTISFNRNTANTPVFFAATGDILIEGTINVSAGGTTRTGGPGGWNGGAGHHNSAAENGFGPAGGEGGPPPVGQGNAGGGGGMATDGGTADTRTGGDPGLGGGWIARPDLRAGETGGGGSGGGGGGGRLFFGVDITGGDGGGGGGALQLSTPGQLILDGTLDAHGAHGKYAFANVFAHGGPGGGGAGGNLVLYAGNLVITSNAVVKAYGGAGGGLSTEPVSHDPFYYSSHANGGQGYFFFDADSFNLDPRARIDAWQIPHPPEIHSVTRAAGQIMLTWGDTNDIQAVTVRTSSDGGVTWDDAGMATDGTATVHAAEESLLIRVER